MNHWKRRALILLAVLVAFFVGRLTAPPKIQEVERERVVYQDRIIEKVVHAKAQDVERRVVVYRDRIVQPDGTRVEREVERSAEAVRTIEAIHEDAQHELIAEGHAERKITTVLPSWRVGALVGGQIRLDSALSLTPSYGALVERRIVGPMSAGAWALNDGTIGLLLTMEF